MKDLTGENTPVQIESGEWYYKGRFIQKQNHPNLMPFISWSDNSEDNLVKTHSSICEAKAYCNLNPCLNPIHKPIDFLR